MNNEFEVLISYDERFPIFMMPEPALYQIYIRSGSEQEWSITQSNVLQKDLIPTSFMLANYNPHNIFLDQKLSDGFKNFFLNMSKIIIVFINMLDKNTCQPEVLNTIIQSIYEKAHPIYHAIKNQDFNPKQMYYLFSSTTEDGKQVYIVIDRLKKSAQRHTTILDAASALISASKNAVYNLIMERTGYTREMLRKVCEVDGVSSIMSCIRDLLFLKDSILEAEFHFFIYVFPACYFSEDVIFIKPYIPNFAKDEKILYLIWASSCNAYVVTEDIMSIPGKYAEFLNTYKFTTPYVRISVLPSKCTPDDWWHVYYFTTQQANNLTILLDSQTRQAQSTSHYTAKFAPLPDPHVLSHGTLETIKK